MKKIARVLVSITCLVLLTVFTIGCADKIDKKTLRHEQERMVEYTLQNFEDVKKIELLYSFYLFIKFYKISSYPLLSTKVTAIACTFH